MPDQHGAAAGAERSVERVGIGYQRPHLVGAVLRDAGGRVTAQERGYRVVSRSSEFGEQVTPGPGGVGEPVKTQCERPGALFQNAEFEPIGRYGAMLDSHVTHHS